MTHVWRMVQVLMVLLALSSPALAAQMCKLEWTLPTSNADGTPLTDLRDVVIYKAPSSGAPFVRGMDVALPQTDLLQPCAPGEVFMVRARDHSLNESADSNAVVVGDKLPPGPVGSFKITVTVEVTP